MLYYPAYFESYPTFNFTKVWRNRPIICTQHLACIEIDVLKICMDGIDAPRAIDYPQCHPSTISFPPPHAPGSSPPPTCPSTLHSLINSLSQSIDTNQTNSGILHRLLQSPWPNYPRSTRPVSTMSLARYPPRSKHSTCRSLGQANA